MLSRAFGPDDHTGNLRGYYKTGVTRRVLQKMTDKQKNDKLKRIQALEILL